MNRNHVFRSMWWLCNLLLTVALVATVCTGLREYSVREYLRGFSDAIIPEGSSPQAKVDAILSWMRYGPPRLNSENLRELSPRDPEDTLNYHQLLAVCGSATNAFLNLSRSAGVPARRLLLLMPDQRTKHVVAEVFLNERWVVVDATYRSFLKDINGNLLSREQLQDPKIFNQAASLIPNYIRDFSYERLAHVRIPALPFLGFSVRPVLDRFWPGWDESVYWSLLLERRSFLYLFVALNALFLLLVLRIYLAWLADQRFRVPRFHLRHSLVRAATVFFSAAR